MNYLQLSAYQCGSPGHYPLDKIISVSAYMCGFAITDNRYIYTYGSIFIAIVFNCENFVNHI